MAEMTIGQVAEQAGLRTSALRYYERVGLLPRASRVSGQRRYGPEVLEWLAAIRLLQQAGFTVSEIKRLFHGFPRAVQPSERWRELARDKLIEVDDLIQRANEMKRLLEEGIRCGCSSLRECTLLGGARSPRSTMSDSENRAGSTPSGCSSQRGSLSTPTRLGGPCACPA